MLKTCNLKFTHTNIFPVNTMTFYIKNIIYISRHLLKNIQCFNGHTWHYDTLCAAIYNQQMTCLILHINHTKIWKCLSDSSFSTLMCHMYCLHQSQTIYHGRDSETKIQTAKPYIYHLYFTAANVRYPC